MGYINKYNKLRDYLAEVDTLPIPNVNLMADNGQVVLSSDPQGTEYVDLGLPSGIKWATKNIGAKNIWDAGMYFSWGNIDGHYEDEEYDFSKSNYSSTDGHGLSGNIPVNEDYDAAVALLGSEWRMPTKAEFQELYDNTDAIWCKVGKMKGMLFVSKINKQSVFFPASGNFDGTSLNDRGSLGYYWSSSFYSAASAYYLRFISGDVNPQSDNYFRRYYGLAVRAVQD